LGQTTASKQPLSRDENASKFRLITVLVVEDDHATRARLCDAIAGQPNMRLGAACDRVLPALEWLDSNQPDLLLTDLGLPDGSGIDVIKRCATRHPACNILVITMFGDEKNVLSSVEAGASGYILKDAEQLDVGRAMRELLAGGSPMSPVIARKVLNRARSPENSVAAPGTVGEGSRKVALTGRETEALNLIARGYTYDETALKLAISLSTVQTYVKSIYGKLAVNSRSHAVLEAHRQGLLQDDLFSKRK
jgi:DNA-binding NarL/FixJ family response regulator